MLNIAIVCIAPWEGTVLRVFSYFALSDHLDCYFSCTFVHIHKAIEGRLLWEEIQGHREARPCALHLLDIAIVRIAPWEGTVIIG